MEQDEPGLEIRIWRMAGQMRELADQMERDIGRQIRARRSFTPTITLPAGLPCTADVVWDENNDATPVGVRPEEIIEAAALHDSPPSRPA